MRADIVDKIRAAGVVGAGGAGFPTHVKLQFEVEQVLGNGASCEPLLVSDPYLLEHHIDLILDGLSTVMDCTNAGKATICKMNTDDHRDAAIEYSISSIPTIILFKDGQVAQKWVGLTTKQDMTDAIDELLA